MKGISLAIETIIVLIIGIAVLFALLGLFQHFFGPTQPALDSTKLRVDKCGEYARIAPIASCFTDKHAQKPGAESILTGDVIKIACPIDACKSGLTKLCISKCCGDYGFCSYSADDLK